MSFELPKQSNRKSMQPPWSGAAVLIESMLLLVFLIAAIAVFTQMFATSLSRSGQSDELTAAVAAASETAEHFAAHPTQVAGEQVVGDLKVVCDVQGEQRRAGTLYRADIAVYSISGDSGGSGSGGGSEPVYSISTSRFESEVG